MYIHRDGEYEPITRTPPMTNADRIRAMSDEELAEFLAGTWNKIYNCLDWLDWLKQEVKP